MSAVLRAETNLPEKIVRLYDDEHCRLESWLGDYMQFHQTAEGKIVFLSIDSRLMKHNPLLKMKV